VTTHSIDDAALGLTQGVIRQLEFLVLGRERCFGFANAIPNVEGFVTRCCVLSQGHPCEGFFGGDLTPCIDDIVVTIDYFRINVI
jgi:hypothetical protein